MTAMLEVLGWLIFLIGVGFSIGLHEIGHLVPAKAFGVKVTQYMVGFGPTIWSRHKGETEYGVKAVPLGGYIRMIGMYPPEKDADPTKLRASSTGRFSVLIEDARKQSLEEIGPEDTDRVFYKLPVHKRVMIMLGGPSMNLFLALVMFTIVLCGIGMYQATTTVAKVVPCTPASATASGALVNGSCPKGTSASPAYAAGLKTGDTIVSINGTSVSTWDEQNAAIKAAPTGEVPIVVDRDGRQLTLTADLVAVSRPVVDAQGQTTGQTEVRNFLGVSPETARVPMAVTEVPSYVWGITTNAIHSIVTLPARMWDLARQTFTSEPRDPNGIVGVVGVGRITGDVVAMNDTPVIDKTASVLYMLAGLNLFLFLFNLIPLLPLDGGHVAGAVWESLKRAWSRVRHLPDPGPVDTAKALPLTYAMSIVLVGMGAITILADLIKPITIGG
jgi:membrane-associated protease RseP (regulator of RpoE activity)